jgi:hypothetical protein
MLSVPWGLGCGSRVEGVHVHVHVLWYAEGSVGDGLAQAGASGMPLFLVSVVEWVDDRGHVVCALDQHQLKNINMRRHPTTYIGHQMFPYLEHAVEHDVLIA